VPAGSRFSLEQYKGLADKELKEKQVGGLRGAGGGGCLQQQQQQSQSQSQNGDDSNASGSWGGSNHSITS
jgi:hypothetical protein